jgi:hypothetical protein
MVLGVTKTRGHHAGGELCRHGYLPFRVRFPPEMTLAGVAADPEDAGLRLSR